MSKPADILRNKVISPLYNVYENYISKSARHKTYQKISSFLFGKGTDIALVMLVGNAVSMLNSHLAQIRGLKKSNRENKDYLISQERIDLVLDLILSTIPPAMLNYHLKRKLESGEIITKSVKKEVIRMAEEAGVLPEDILKTNSPKSYFQTMKQSLNSIFLKLKTIMKNKPKKLWNLINVQDINPAEKIGQKVKTAESALLEEKLQQVYNQNSYKSLVNKINGATIISTLLYSIIVSSIVMPIIKNSIANYSYKKQLEKMGETPESLKLKKRYNDLMMVSIDKSDKNIFSEFMINNSQNINKGQQGHTNVFQNMNTFVSSGLKI